MGIVYVARHLAVGKRVALKVLRQQFVQDAEVTQRFAAEATAATAIGNAHIVDTLDFGKLQNGSAYQVMEFLEGQMLSEALRRERRNAARADPEHRAPGGRRARRGAPLTLASFIAISSRITCSWSSASKAGIS